ncbi:hypothetical protein ASF47_18710 [Nocardioides sp. Leaf285]|nr:hypothetical protein ASF47_18710 [Nocardioides sp. Leaf285]
MADRNTRLDGTASPDAGPFYAFDNPTIERADLHGCLDEDVETGAPIVCVSCASRTATGRSDG